MPGCPVFERENVVFPGINVSISTEQLAGGVAAVVCGDGEKINHPLFFFFKVKEKIALLSHKKTCHLQKEVQLNQKI